MKTRRRISKKLEELTKPQIMAEKPRAPLDAWEHKILSSNMPDMEIYHLKRFFDIDEITDRYIFFKSKKSYYRDKKGRGIVLGYHIRKMGGKRYMKNFGQLVPLSFFTNKVSKTTKK